MTYFKLSPKKLLEKQGIRINDRQEEIIKSVNENRVTCVCATRRGGKSMISAACACAKLLEPNKYCGLTSGLMVHTGIIFDYIVNNFKDTLNIKPIKLNNKDKHLKLEWGSELRASTLRNRKAISGFDYSMFLGDEIALADIDSADFLFEEILPATINSLGHILLVTTPKGNNFFKELWDTAEKEKDWNRIKYTIYDVDHINPKEIENMERLYKERNMERIWQQEYLCEFTSYSGAIFSWQPKIVETVPEPDLIITATDPGSVMGFVKIYINRKHGIFVVEAKEVKASTKEQGKLLVENTEDADTNYYDWADKRFCVDMAYEYDISLTKAVKDFDEGINFLRRLEGFLHIHKDVDEILYNEWVNYHMKDDKIVKKNTYHVLDALRYAVYSAYVHYPEEFDFLIDDWNKDSLVFNNMD